MPTIGERIREIREGTDLSQSDLARAVGMTPDKINKIEHNGRGVSATELHSIATAMNVRTERLLRDPVTHFRGPHDVPGAEEALATFDRFIDNWLTADALLRVHDRLA